MMRRISRKMYVKWFRLSFLIIWYFLMAFILFCNAKAEQKNKPSGFSQIQKKKFKKYWNQGKAEINRYQLKQARYSSMAKGDLILIFVTEDFLTDKQVKNETYTNPNSVPILKLNSIRKFFTGIYDYSTMVSVFTPIDFVNHSGSLKISTSSQEWCGHSYKQINLNKDKLKVVFNSYFEKKVLEEYDLDRALLEDEIFTKIRLHPSILPKGNIKIVPSSLDSTLRHYKLKEEPATASLFPFKKNTLKYPGKNLMVYEVIYKHLDRKVQIIFEDKFPYKISGFKETFRSFGKLLTTSAVRTHSILNTYWKENQPKYLKNRKKLGL